MSMGEMADLEIDRYFDELYDDGWGDYGEDLVVKCQGYTENHLSALLTYFQTRGMTAEHLIVADELRERMDNMSDLFEDLEEENETTKR